MLGEEIRSPSYRTEPSTKAIFILGETDSIARVLPSVHEMTRRTPFEMPAHRRRAPQGASYTRVLCRAINTQPMEQHYTDAQ